MKPYLIVSHDYTRVSAGVRALHGLCHHLNDRGYKAWVTSDVVDPSLKTPTADDEKMADICEGGIVVYPEVETGNKLSARRVARYILNRPGFVRGATEFDPSEETFCYCGLLSEFAALDRELTVPVIDMDVFTNHPVSDRRDALLWKGKAFDSADNGDLRLAVGQREITLDWPGSTREMASEFRRAELFVTYTAYTALTIEARLCECPVLVFDDTYTKDDLERGFPGGSVGLHVVKRSVPNFLNAFFLIKEWTRVPDFRQKYLDHMRMFPDQLSRFIEITQAMARKERT